MRASISGSSEMDISESSEMEARMVLCVYLQANAESSALRKSSIAQILNCYL